MRLENLDDGAKLESAWNDALNSSQQYFKALLASNASTAWKLVSVLPLTASTTARDSGKSTAKSTSLGRITASDVVVHRRSGKLGEVYRAVVEVDCGTDVSVDAFRGCLSTPETRPHWDRMVEESQILDLLDPQTRVTRTNYRLGWPSSPRDAVVISKTLVDQHTLVDISTSLPRSRHEPAYLRPAPPYVRAHITLLAWCVQLPASGRTVDPPLAEGRARITCFWSWNPKGAWAVGGGVPQHLPSVMVGLVDYVREGAERVPVLLSYGSDVSIGGVHYDSTRVTLSVAYAIVNEGDLEQENGSKRQVEFGLSSTEGWDVQIHVKTQNGEDSPSTLWTSFVGQAPPTSPGSAAPKQLVLRFAHAQLQPTEEMVRVKISIERTSSSAASGMRINGIPVTIEPMEPFSPSKPVLEETASSSGISLQTMSTLDSAGRDASIETKRKESGWAVAAERSIAALIKRNYIYFTSLLQEPEPKWRPVADSRGVAVHQLNSIDKTLVVFRAEAVFVGVGVWDLYATIASPGSRLIWDKSYEDALLLEDVNELTDLWHLKSKAAWPVAARDSVLLRTTYKSPSSVHIFGFSTDNTDLFPIIPPSVDPTVIRTQIDLQGWSIEALSPNTTQVTLLEQSDPRGWSNKSSIPQVMMNTLAGLGEFAIRHGAPPAATRLGGAKAVVSKYDVEKETFRFEYEAAETRRSNSSSTATAFPLPVAVRDAEPNGETASIKSLGLAGVPLSNIECEIRCDVEQWSNNLTIVIDPPQKGLSALKRHRMSPNGGGLWLTIEHEPTLSERVAITIRRGASTNTGKTTATVNGTKIKIDTEDLSEADVQLLKKQKRSKPTRVPLDHPPALGTIRKRQSKQTLQQPQATAIDPARTISPTTSFGRIALPLSRWYSAAAETTKAAIVPMTTPSPAPTIGSTPVDAAVQALRQLIRMHADRDGESTDPFGWQPVSDRDGLKVERRIVPHVSETFPVFRAGRIIEGFTAEEISAAVSVSRKSESFEKAVRLQSYGHGISTSQVVAHTTFPFRDRNALMATIVARVPDGPPPSPSVASHAPISTIFHAASSSFDPSILGLDATKYNPTTLPNGHVLLEGWILETIDPYSHEQYAIPSTRCMYVGAIDYGGNMPMSVNSMLNASLPRSLLAVEASLKSVGPPTRARWPAMSVFVPDATTQGPWALEGAETDKQPVEQVNNESEFRMTVTLLPVTKTNDMLTPTLKHVESKSSVHSGRSTVIDLAEDIRKTRRDLVIAEVDLASMFIKDGCEIEVRGVSLPAALHSTSDDASVLPLEPDGERIVLPWKCNVIALAPSVMQSASLDPASQARHLLRISLPTSGYEAPVNDPLTGQTHAPLPRPRWLLDLINDGAVVQMRLTPKRVQPPAYTFAGETIVVEDEKKVGRGVAKELSKAKLPQLVNNSTPNTSSLEKPIAVAREFLLDPVSMQPDATTTDAEGSLEDVPQPSADGTAGSTEKSSTEVKESRPLPLSAVTNRYSFWRYAPLNPFVTSAPTSAQTSPIKASATIPSFPTSSGADNNGTHTSKSPTKSTFPSSGADGSGSSEGLDRSIAQRTRAASLTLSSALTSLTGQSTDDLLHRPLVPIPVVIVACLACLLLGSLLRSMLTDADFVIYSTPGTRPPVGETWRELKRLGEWRIGWNRDLIVALARRAPRGG